MSSLWDGKKSHSANMILGQAIHKRLILARVFCVSVCAFKAFGTESERVTRKQRGFPKPKPTKPKSRHLS